MGPRQPSCCVCKNIRTLDLETSKYCRVLVTKVIFSGSLQFRLFLDIYASLIHILSVKKKYLLELGKYFLELGSPPLQPSHPTSKKMKNAWKAMAACIFRGGQSPLGSLRNEGFRVLFLLAPLEELVRGALQQCPICKGPTAPT